MITLRKVFRQADPGEQILLSFSTTRLMIRSFCGLSQPNAFWHDFSEGTSIIRFFGERSNI
jgi:hypothetical protein